LPPFGYDPHNVRALPLRVWQKLWHNDALMSFLHGRMVQVLTLALTAAWLATATCAATQQTPAMHRHMPCCPPQARTQGCSTAQCEQAPEKTEARSAEQVATLLVAETVSFDWAVTPQVDALRKLTPGLRFAAAVFRLKDDLRI
jgi:hypothetical protein